MSIRSRALPPVRPIPVLLALFASLLAPLACEDDMPFGPPPEGIMQDFTLHDVNPNSPLNGQEVSPRQYVGQISAWYFGHAT